MRREEAKVQVVQAAESIFRLLEKNEPDSGLQICSLLEAIENGSRRLRSLMQQMADGPDDPEPKQVDAAHDFAAQLVRISAAAMLLLVISELPSLPPVQVIGWRGQGN